MKGYADYLKMPVAERVANLLKSIGGYARIEDIDHAAFDAAIWAVMVKGDDPQLTDHHDSMNEYPIYEDFKRFFGQK